MPLSNDIKAQLNAQGAAPVFGCRAWVNFNGTGVVAISSSGNVLSITDSGTGLYVVNFITAMPNANYAPIPAGTPAKAYNNTRTFNVSAYAIDSSSAALETYGNTNFEDYANINLAIFG